MPDIPSDDEQHAEEVFNALLGKLVSTPHKPHKQKSNEEASDRKPSEAG